MNHIKNIVLAFMTVGTTLLYAQNPIAHFDMSQADGVLSETVSGLSFPINSQLPPTTIEALDGQALRFDGYSNYAKVSLPANTFSTAALTMTVVLAAESYPMMQTDVAETTPTYATICGNLDETNKKGFALQLSSQGDLRAVVAVNYGTGYLIQVNGSTKLPRGQWNELSLVFNQEGNEVSLHLNGEKIGSKKVNKCSLLPATDFYIGKDEQEVKAYNLFLLNTFCGLIDDIRIYNEIVQPVAFSTTATPDFSYPAERYADNSWRPMFHAMPSGSWTNETHGMTFSNGRYHLFFQKNANGPYMSRLHWGHISSENLCVWQDEPIAVYPGETYDIKGCWSGCVYEDGANTYLFYTGVDNERARIVQAKATDQTLGQWDSKQVVIDGRPTGLSDDFRDPYYFEANGNKYIIVGTAKNGIGACTLHQLKNGAWTNDGALFFQGTNKAQHGTFWEMPNVTPMGNGKWLFTCTPLGTNVGVRTLCWVGTIGTDGRFTPDAAGVQYLEMGGISREGYGLLSPTICQQGDKTLLLGIVPDKLSTADNYKMGWAHLFSLPREISLDAAGQLLQKPYEGLTALRSETTYSQQLTLNGAQSLAPVSGRQIELEGEFTVGTTGTMGFRFLKAGEHQASLTYQTDDGRLILDMTGLSRKTNDQNVYNGTYAVTLPEKVDEGSTLKLHVFLDGSILDIFVNDKWAYSVRLFPTATDEVETEVFSTVETNAMVSAWVLDGTGATGIAAIAAQENMENDRCYDLQGRCIGHSRALSGSSQLRKGIYILNGRKYVIR